MGLGFSEPKNADASLVDKAVRGADSLGEATLIPSALANPKSNGMAVPDAKVISSKGDPHALLLAKFDHGEGATSLDVSADDAQARATRT